MDISYDPRYGIAYIRFREGMRGADTVRIGAEINFDISPDGTVYGIELLNAREQIASGDVITFKDESTGKVFEIPLSLQGEPGQETQDAIDPA